MIKPISGLLYGTDPEAFLARGGAIIGSEKVIPAKDDPNALMGVVRDGVQVEFNPPPARTIAELGLNFRGVVDRLVTHLRKYPKVSIDWRDLVEVTRAELDSLSPENQVLGCQPSENAYGMKPITAGEYYPKRSAGGHLHFGGLGQTIWNQTYGVDHRADIVPLLDIFVGNTCVMVDRGPGQPERRVNYGRAGEYRKQPHGLEYRTLSSFWTRAYPLMDLVFGLGQLAVSIAFLTVNGDRVEDSLRDVVDIDNFILAIDSNDYTLARRNFETLIPFFETHLPKEGFPISPKTIGKFLSLSEGIRDKGLGAYFPDVPEAHWAKGEQVSFAQTLDKLF